MMTLFSTLQEFDFFWTFHLHCEDFKTYMTYMKILMLLHPANVNLRPYILIFD